MAHIPLRRDSDCFLSCTAHLRDGQPGVGVSAYAESLVGIPLTIYLLIVPVVLFLVARRTRRPAVWVAAWLSLHAAIHPFSIAGAAPIYAVLVVGVVLWSAWLWARDARMPRLRGLVRRWAVAVVPVTVIIATTWGAAAISWVPSVPVGVQGARMGTATVQGFNPPDPSDWFPQIIVPRTPAGSGCFDPVVRPAGRLDVCWEAYRDNREHLPGADYYQFRLIATLHAAAPSTWAAISIVPVGDDRTRVEHIWPSGVLDGPCRTAAVEGMDFLTNGEMTVTSQTILSAVARPPREQMPGSVIRSSGRVLAVVPIRKRGGGSRSGVDSDVARRRAELAGLRRAWPVSLAPDSKPVSPVRRSRLFVIRVGRCRSVRARLRGPGP